MKVLPRLNSTLRPTPVRSMSHGNTGPMAASDAGRDGDAASSNAAPIRIVSGAINGLVRRYESNSMRICFCVTAGNRRARESADTLQT